MDILYTESAVGIYYDHQRIASHPKFPDYVQNRYHTDETHMPDAFRQPEMHDARMRSWAASVEPNTAKVIDRIFNSVQIKEHGYNAALAVLKLSRSYSKERFENTCSIGLMRTASPGYRLLHAILSNNQDLLQKEQPASPVQHKTRQLQMRMDADMYREHPITEVDAMITDETRRKLREMKLDGLLATLDEQAEHPDLYLSMDFDQRIDMVVDNFYQRRNSERAKRLLSHTKLRHPKAGINNLYYDGRRMDGNKSLSLATGNYISTCRNIIINGYTGSG